eukprot:TRINITY_DN136_c0_g1_i2.p1 TRINITY_DN136_c0_g1~~TRINITY_DN136_c0_g1_i2.p1  ORF type:complete len:252 (+),score=22.68 TRINITY_DN136_c0_g1_i2:220-975(+)
MNFASLLLQQNEKHMRALSERAGLVRQEPEINLDGAVSLYITHSIMHEPLGEHRLDRMHTVSEIKERLHLVVGTHPDHMHLELWHMEPFPERICIVDDDDRPLGTYPHYEYCRLHVVDMAPWNMADLDLEGEVEKYVMPDDVYEQREGTVRQFRREHPEMFQAPFPHHIKVGERCYVHDLSGDEDQPQRTGVIRYVGKTEFAKGYWVGIEFDSIDMNGKNDGEVNGKRYFQCADKMGAFVRPRRVTPIIEH